MSQEALRDLLQLLEMQEIKPNTPQYDFKVLEAKVGWCQERQGVPSCDACPQVEDCEISLRYRAILVYSPEIIDPPKV